MNPAPLTLIRRGTLEESVFRAVATTQLLQEWWRAMAAVQLCRGCDAGLAAALVPNAIALGASVCDLCDAFWTLWLVKMDDWPCACSGIRVGVEKRLQQSQKETKASTKRNSFSIKRSQQLRKAICSNKRRFSDT